MKYLDMVKEQRTRRVMEKTTIKKDDLIDVIEHARYAASAMNRQIIRYAIVQQEEQVKTIFDVTNLPKKGLPFEAGPSAFIVMGQVETEEKTPDIIAGLDIGIAYQIIREALYEKGLSDVFIYSFDRNLVKDMIDDETFTPIGVIGIGKSDQKVIIHDGGTGFDKDENDNHVINKLTVEDLIIYND